MFTDEAVVDGLKRYQRHKFTMGNAKVFIFGHSPKVLNVAGLKCLEDIQTTRENIESHFDVKCTDVRIDNIFISHKDSKNLDMTKVYDYVRNKWAPIYLADYNIELFPGMFLKPKCKGWPTIILFRTGSYQIMGGKDVYSVLEAKSLVQTIVYNFVK